MKKTPAIWASAKDLGYFSYNASIEVGKPERELRGLLRKFEVIRKSLEGFRGELRIPHACL